MMLEGNHAHRPQYNEFWPRRHMDDTSLYFSVHKQKAPGSAIWVALVFEAKGIRLSLRITKRKWCTTLWGPIPISRDTHFYLRFGVGKAYLVAKHVRPSQKVTTSMPPKSREWFFGCGCRISKVYQKMKLKEPGPTGGRTDEIHKRSRAKNKQTRLPDKRVDTPKSRWKDATKRRDQHKGRADETHKKRV